jgi:hypothetical protein
VHGPLIGSSAPAGEIRIANPSAQEQVPTALEKATKEQPWQNSLGMKFVPVPGTQVLFCIWDTQVEDYSAFVDATGNDTTGGMWSLGQDGWKQLGATWKDPGFSQGPTHPVVGVSWYDATAFCAWLTTRDRRSGVLPAGASYRLPTDQEWSIVVGLDSESGTTPEEKDSKVRLYPWGTMWPPPPGAGNYCGVEAKIGNEPEGLIVIEDYYDGYPRTSPVGSFPPNKHGLYDMGATSGSTVKIGTIRRKFFVCCAVHRGTTSILSESSLHFVAFTRQIVVVRTLAFVVFLLGSLRGEAAAVFSELMDSFSVLVCMLRVLRICVMG